MSFCRGSFGGSGGKRGLLGEFLGKGPMRARVGRRREPVREDSGWEMSKTGSSLRCGSRPEGDRDRLFDLLSSSSSCWFDGSVRLFVLDLRESILFVEEGFVDVINYRAVVDRRFTSRAE